MKTKTEILQRMDLYRVDVGGIGSWLTKETCDAVFERLGQLDSEKLSAVQLNQLLVLAHEAPVSDGFFRYYWLECPDLHPYNVPALPGFQSSWEASDAITSLDHLAWGLHRLYVDGLLFYGNIRTAFRALREKSRDELYEYFSGKRFDTDRIKSRGPALPLRSIDKNRRYLISEMACKSYGERPQIGSDLRSALTKGLAAHIATAGQGSITIRELLAKHLPPEFESARYALVFSASETLDEHVTSQNDVDDLYLRIAGTFDGARKDALKNTEYYLSMLTDLDVYVATSMREPSHFLRMAEVCERVFGDERLKAMNLRYFDPTLSAANGHEDKGLIECLMVKCAKALVYCGGDKESYGKDAEAAMALSLGRPVIFFCENRPEFYRDTHPLTRLIQFETGVAVGAMVTDKLEHVAELLARTFENRMIYSLERTPAGSLRLKEELTGSVVRLQTSDKLLSETFWNHYHQDRGKRPARAVAVPEPKQARPRATVTSIPMPAAQTRLPLPETGELVPMAARSSPAKSDDVALPSASSSRPAVIAKETFPLSTSEVFNAISKIKTSQPSGARRYSAFEQWFGSERIGIYQGVKLLRFVEATLDANNARSTYVYKAADLARWYAEMCDGKVVGSWR